MINNWIITFKKCLRQGDVTKKHFLDWNLVAELLCYTKRLIDNVNNKMFAKLFCGNDCHPSPTPFAGIPVGWCWFLSPKSKKDWFHFLLTTVEWIFIKSNTFYSKLLSEKCKIELWSFIVPMLFGSGLLLKFLQIPSFMKNLQVY